MDYMEIASRSSTTCPLTGNECTYKLREKSYVYLSITGTEEHGSLVHELKSALSSLGLDLITTYSLPFSGEMMLCKICRYIREALFVLAEVTDAKPNGFFEVGFATGVGKRLILLKRDGAQPLPLSLIGQQCISYRHTEELVTKLREVVNSSNQIQLSLARMKESIGHYEEALNIYRSLLPSLDDAQKRQETLRSLMNLSTKINRPEDAKLYANMHEQLSGDERRKRKLYESIDKANQEIAMLLKEIQTSEEKEDNGRLYSSLHNVNDFLENYRKSDTLSEQEIQYLTDLAEYRKLFATYPETEIGLEEMLSFVDKAMNSLRVLRRIRDEEMTWSERDLLKFLEDATPRQLCFLKVLSEQKRINRDELVFQLKRLLGDGKFGGRSLGGLLGGISKKMKKHRKDSIYLKQEREDEKQGWTCWYELATRYADTIYDFIHRKENATA